MDLSSTNYNESFSLSDVIVHVLPQNITDTDNLVPPTPLLSPTSGNTASSSSSSTKSVPLLSSVSRIYYPRETSTSDKSMFGYIDVKEPNEYSPEVWQISSEESVYNATFDILPHTTLNEQRRGINNWNFA
jgi:hypothetical protein